MAIKNLFDILKSTTKLPEADIKAAIENTEEVELVVPKLVIRTEAEEASLQETIKQEKKTSWDSAVETTEKRLVQAELDKLGLSTALENKAKTFENLRPLLKDHFVKEAGIAPDKKVKELEADNEKLRGNYQTLENSFNTYKTQVQQQEEQRRLDDEIYKAIPEDGDYVIPRSEILLLVKAKNRFKFENEIPVGLNAAGEIIKSTTDLKPVPITEIVGGFVKPYIKPASGGSGSGDQTGDKNKPGSYENFVTEMAGKNIAEGTEEFNREMTRRIKDKTLVM